MNTIEQLQESIEILKPYQEYKEIQYNKIQDMFNSYKQDLVQLERKDRLLSIAIVGQVKAGKSSFLNAVLFNGETILPKAATPMTAALTVIRYAEKISAEVEFYSDEDWQAVENANNDYAKIFQEHKRKLVELYPDRLITDREVLTSASISEELRAANELISMIKKSELEYKQYLGKTETIDGIESLNDLIGKLEEFVGVKGRYTPIVKSSTLYYNDPKIKDIEIIDTPGINDPVVSRGKKTKDLLGRCDIVFMLSRCGTFFDISDLNILAHNLPEKGIKDIVLVGSQLDIEMQGEYHKYNSVTELLYNLESKLKKYAKDTINRLKTNCKLERELEIIARLEKALPPIFVSAMAFNIAQHCDHMNEDEQYYFNQYNQMFPGFKFDREILLDLSNIDKVKEILLEQKQKREEIFQGRVKERKHGLITEIYNELDKSMNLLSRTYTRLGEEDLESLVAKEKDITARLNKGRNNVEGAFDNSIIEIEKNFAILKTEIRELAYDFSRIEEHQVDRTENYIHNEPRKFLSFDVSWAFGHKSETRTRTISYRYAYVHDAIDKVERMILDAERMIKQSMLEIIDLPKFKSQVKKGAIELFDLSDESFSLDDIIVPVERATARIMIPDIEIKDDGYGEQIAAEFGSGKVQDSAVDSLRTTQKKIIKTIINDIGKQISEEMNKTVSVLKKARDEFVDHLMQDIQEELNSLKLNKNEKEQALKNYQQMISMIEDIKNGL